MKKIVASTLLFISLKASCQDVAFAHKMVDTLASSAFWGRGYTNDGMMKAADFISQQFKKYGLSPIKNSSYYQPFTYPVNTFPGRMEVSVNQKKLVPGKDFIVSPDSRGVHASGKLEQKDSTHFINPAYRIIVSLENKLTWSVAGAVADYTTIQIDKKVAADLPRDIQVDIENKEIPAFKAVNVCGWVKGTVHPDSIIVISAHYDHLGGMGAETYFPGANDNASGTSLLLGLAKYYAAHPQPYTIAFISFAGEEAGLLGSKYFTQNPLFPLKNIRFLLNLDLEGTGDEGITVVNATEFSKEFATLNAVNNSENYLVKINARGKAANSDHYWFTEKGVPAFFLYTLGGIKAYHDVFDKAETLPLIEYEDLFKLILGFNQKLMK
ncbi:MAG: M28 family metallopeptidase [Segetibacter sp.]